MNTHEGYSKTTLDNTQILLAGGGHKPFTDFIGSIQYNSTSKTLQYRNPYSDSQNPPNWLNIVTLGARAFDDTAYVTVVGNGTGSHINQLYYTKNGSNNYFTVNYASTSDFLLRRSTAKESAGVQFIVGQIATTDDPTNDKAFKGSSNNFKVLSFPLGGTAINNAGETNETANISIFRIAWSTAWWHDLHFSPNITNIYHRTVQSDTANDWRILVETDGNKGDSTTPVYVEGGLVKECTSYTNASVASAGKLTTARTIWGQSFNGTGNVSGNMSSVGNISFSASGKNIGSILYFDTTNSRLGVGTDSPSYKLHVVGDIYTTTGFKKKDSSDSYVLLGGGGHKALTDFLHKVTVANNTTNDFNTFENMTLTGRGDPTTGASLSNAPWTGKGPGGGYGVLTYLWSGYGILMAWGYNNNHIYIRNKYYTNNSASWSDSWSTVALTSDLSGFLTSQDHYKTSITAGTAGTSSATSGNSLSVPYVTVNANGHVTGYGTHTHTITGFLTPNSYLFTVDLVGNISDNDGDTIDVHHNDHLGIYAGSCLYSYIDSDGINIFHLYIGSASTVGTSVATNGGSISIPWITTDDCGHITDKGTHNHTITQIYVTLKSDDVTYPLVFTNANNTSQISDLYKNYSNIVYNPYKKSFAHGDSVSAYGTCATAEGIHTLAYNYSHAEGSYTYATGDTSHAEGYNTLAQGLFSHAEGQSTTAAGINSHAEGVNTEAGPYAHAEGSSTYATGDTSHAEGYNNTASAQFSHAEGSGNTASGWCSHVGGNGSTSSGDQSFAHGSNNTSSGWASFAANSNTTASGVCAFACGQDTLALHNYEFATGHFNSSNSDTRFSVGGGDSSSNRLNLFEVKSGGNVHVKNILYTTDISLTSFSISSGITKFYVSDNNFIKYITLDNLKTLFFGGTGAVGSTTQPIYWTGSQFAVSSSALGGINIENSTSTFYPCGWTSLTTTTSVGTSSQKLKAYSGFYVNSTGAYHNSDVRLKYDINNVTNYDVVKLFETDNAFVHHYKWRSNDKASYGFIAQEVMHYCPEAVDFNKDTGYYTVNYDVILSKLVGVMFKKIKELEKEIETLKNS